MIYRDLKCLDVNNKEGKQIPNPIVRFRRQSFENIKTPARKLLTGMIILEWIAISQ